MSKGKNELIFGQSAAISRVLEDCVDFAPSDDPVLLTGETGTGKSWLARHIHEISRRPGRYIEAPVPQLEELAQGQLRGNTEGAFTDAKRARKGVIELADGGTLFLDEVATASPQLQEMLLTIVEASEVWPLGASRPVPVNVRMVFASNESLPDRSSDGAFRWDLYYRIETLSIRLPALRDRPEDIPVLARAFLDRIALRHGREAPRLTPRALAKLQAAPWPGNLRELDSVLTRSFLRLRGRTQMDAAQIAIGSPATASGSEPDACLSPEELRQALASNRGNLAATARKLGINERTFRRQVQTALGPRSKWHLDSARPGRVPDLSRPIDPPELDEDHRAAS